ncbi:MAG: radical SAM family heme chaperone HemW [Alphaproteobacteria bacterium]|nr:radical SAM family heme chaperone HemW [Alphaproteobacteria bacterium]MBL6776320.1 radical SAM family heme chaperone HemW [Alphaproteobacteria bacterium]
MPAISLYVHWPFCLAKCPYCDFNSHVATDIDTKSWQQALVTDLERQAENTYQQLEIESGKIELKSVFFGGGTPSLMPPAIIEALLTKAAGLFTIDPDIEITAEANPTSAETAKLKGFYGAGINRLSLGVQSLRESGLQFLGREHSAKDALTALEEAAKLFPRWSADLIYGLPEQSEEDWRAQLEEIILYAPSHLSCYQLTIEPGTQFYTRHKKGERLTGDADNIADLYLLTETILKEKGLSAYEISNYAKQGEASQHNLNYWQTGNWLGIGPGAHGRLTTKNGRYNRINRRSPSGWLESINTAQGGMDIDALEKPEDYFNEYWMMGLRLTSGVKWPETAKFGNTALQLNPKWLEAFIKEGWLNANDAGLSTTLEGRLRLDSILSHLLD